MTIHYLKEDCLEALRINAANNLAHYQEPTNQWLFDFFDGDTPFAEYQTPIGDFEFVLSDGGSQKGADEVENTIRLYSAMKDISDTQATDERLWAGLCHGDFWDFMHRRWQGQPGQHQPEAAVLNRYFMKSKSGLRRSLFLNTLSRYWWIGRLTYDESRREPFELTRYFEKDFATKSLIIFSSNFTGSRPVLHGLLEALIAMEQDNGQRSRRNDYYEAANFLNVYGGTHILDYFEKDEIREKVLKHLKTHN